MDFYDEQPKDKAVPVEVDDGPIGELTDAEVNRAILAELRVQRFAGDPGAKLVDGLAQVTRIAVGVALGLTLFWGVTQLIGTGNFGLPVKSYVTAEQVDDVSIEPLRPAETAP